MEGDEVGSRFISAVALYGPKAGALRDFLAGAHARIAEQIGGDFRPYSLDQIHATLVALNGVPDPETGAIVNEYYLANAGVAREMDIPRVMDTLARHFASPLRVRIGGFLPGQQVPFTSRGQHLSERAFSAQGNAFVLLGWPAASLAGAGRPLDELRRDMNAANVLHRYHRRDTDVDDDFYLVVGHHRGAPAPALARAVDAVREKLAGDPIDLEIGLGDVKIVAADSHTLAPPLLVSDVPADEAALRRLMFRCPLWSAILHVYARLNADSSRDHGAGCVMGCHRGRGRDRTDMGHRRRAEGGGHRRRPADGGGHVGWAPSGSLGGWRHDPAARNHRGCPPQG
jgi:hypothetical protein